MTECEYVALQVRELGATDCGDLMVFPLYAAMPLAMQARVFQPVPHGTRRCIVATNIAETSITLDGVVYVVDSGVCKEKTYDCATGALRTARALCALYPDVICVRCMSSMQRVVGMPGVK